MAFYVENTCNEAIVNYQMTGNCYSCDIQGEYANGNGALIRIVGIGERKMNDNAKKIDKNTRVKILGMPDVCESGFDFAEESTLWDSYHVMMKHFRDENRTRYRSDNFYQFTVTSEFGILYQFYLNALDISPNIAQYVDIDEDAVFLERKYTNSETEKIYKEAVKQRNDLYKDFPEQTIYNN